MDVHGITLAHFGEAIMPYAGRPVLDKTALPGRFSFSLHWASDHDPTQPNGPTLFTAVQEQLGLKLMPSKGAVTVLVVDHADAPTPD
ncbi:TIGR03435 family protein [Acidipila sp. EB88]|nr:TIGR03435 family protein [Acidipila sp. EB88]